MTIGAIQVRFLSLPNGTCGGDCLETQGCNLQRIFSCNLWRKHL